MARDASELSRRLAQNVEAVCRHYLSSGRRQGRYWLVGDVRNTPGRSMFVRLSGPDFGPGAAGHWTDAASFEHGDLLDVIRESCGFVDFRDVADEARRFLSLPNLPPSSVAAARRSPAPQGSAESARRLFAASRSIGGSLAERYLQGRRLTAVAGLAALRFHPRCFYRPEGSAENLSFPALIASVTDLSGAITGLHRTWLDPAGGKAPIETRDAQWVISSAMLCALERPRMCWPPVKALRPCSRCARFCPICRWRPRSPPTISPLSYFRQDCAFFTSCTMRTRPVTQR
jgi:hypothetical protein